MGDPFVIACIALGLSVVASAVRMVDWFLHADPKVAAEVMRWGARGVAAASVPLLMVLLFKEQWTAATALAAAMVLAPAVLGRRPVALGRRPVAGGPQRARACKLREAPSMRANARSPTRPSSSGIRRRCSRPICAGRRRPRAAVACRRLRTTAAKTSAPTATARRTARARRTATAWVTAWATGKANGAGKSGNGHAESFGLGAMSEEEACAVLGVAPGATEAEIRAAHGRISAAVDPAGGGSPYLAIKVDQAKEVLVRAGAPAKASPPPRRRASAA